MFKSRAVKIAAGELNAIAPLADDALFLLIKNRKERQEKVAADRKWDPPAIGSEAREEMPASSFLDPEHKKYPVDEANPRSMRAAISRASQNNRPDVAAKARKMLEAYHAKHAGLLNPFTGIHNLRNFGGVQVAGRAVKSGTNTMVSRGLASSNTIAKAVK